MDSPIRLFYATNIIARQKGGVRQQTLTFAARVRRLSYEKTVEVHWAGSDGVWHTAPAKHHAPHDAEWEIWRATVRVSARPGPLPGNVTFALRLSRQGQVFWDNQAGRNYALDTEAGFLGGSDQTLIHLEPRPTLTRTQKFLPLAVAVNHTAGAPRRVFVRWTRDHWQTTHDEPLKLAENYWARRYHSPAHNPNHHGWGLWHGRLRLGGAYRVEYTVGCELASGQVVWENNAGANYAAQHRRLKVLTLNLHCYQETHQAAKFTQIAKAIRDLDIDVVCLQEVAEPWNNGAGDWADHAGQRLQKKLGAGYHLHTDWAHLGFDKYREGVALLSRFPLQNPASRYLSADHNIYSIHARKAVFAQVNVPAFGLLNVFSAHLSWWDGGFAEQFDTLRAWAAECHTPAVLATLIGGDFNVPVGSAGYRHMLQTREFDDQFLKVLRRPVFDAVFPTAPPAGVDDPAPANWSGLAHDGRIDYILLKTGSPLRAVAARELFTPQDAYGPVSDHVGYLVEFEPT